MICFMLTSLVSLQQGKSSYFLNDLMDFNDIFSEDLAFDNIKSHKKATFCALCRKKHFSKNHGVPGGEDLFRLNTAVGWRPATLLLYYKETLAQLFSGELCTVSAILWTILKSYLGYFFSGSTFNFFWPGCGKLHCRQAIQ